MREVTRPTNAVIVSIGIQARSTSVRFPNKINQLIDRKTVLQHVIDSTKRSSSYMNHWNTKKISVQLALLLPEEDDVDEATSRDITIIHGSEDDVLSRYVDLQKIQMSDYIVRITADCPLIPPFLISKMITLAVTNNYDYVANVDERCRTAPDGYDVEVMSARLLEYINENATDKVDREHVTIYARKNPPQWIRWGHVINFLDFSSTKISVDTIEDLERVRDQFSKVEKALITANRIFGKNSVHRF